MAEIILAEQTIDGFSYMETYGAYVELRDGETIPLKVGNTYTVIWDGTKYECVGQDTNDLDEGSVTVGNLASFDLSGNGEPFAVVGGTEGVVYMSFEEGESHTVAIYDGGVLDDSGSDQESELILSEQTLSFIKNTNDDIYCSNGDALSLTAGNTYTVVWDGVSYVCVAEDVVIPEGGAIALGNKSVDNELFPDGVDTKEPFLIGTIAAYNMTLFETLETDETHTIAVYKGDTTAGDGDGTEDGYLLKDAELAFELETNSETVYVNNEVAVALSVGKTYTVIWDGNYYDCTAKEYTPTDGGNTWTFVTLGNLSIQNIAEENTREPFVYLYVSLEGNRAANFKTLEKDASHVISIYDGVLEHPAVTYADIYTYDKDGKAVLHEKRSSVTFDTPDGRYAVFKLSHIADSRS